MSKKVVVQGTFNLWFFCMMLDQYYLYRSTFLSSFLILYSNQFSAIILHAVVVVCFTFILVLNFSPYNVSLIYICKDEI